MITGLSATVAGSTTYRIHGQLYWENVTAQVNQSLAFAVSAGNWTGRVTLQTTMANASGSAVSVYMTEAISTTAATLPSTSSGTGTIFATQIDGWMAFGLGGTFSLTGAEGASSDEWEVVGAFIDLMPA